MRILYIGMEVIGKPKTGGEYGQLRNRSLLQKVSNEVTIIEIPKIGLVRHAINLMTGKSYGYTPQLMKKINLQLAQNYDYVFFDSSTYGAYVKFFCKKGFKTIVFCHNVEYDYFKTKWNSQRSFMNYVLVHYIHRQEYLSVHHATKLITLNDRDNQGLFRYYGRNADLVLPLFYEALSVTEITKDKSDKKYLLFVGADFCANNDGIAWFIKNVCPFINIEVRVAGGCCNAINQTLKIDDFPNVKLLGFVDDLDSEYIKASGVICPIFAGSGMKTKTVEALKYGKTIFGTTEAFEGINVDFSVIGGLCNTAEEFIDCINNSRLSQFNKETYDFFLKYFSTDAIYPIFRDFITHI